MRKHYIQFGQSLCAFAGGQFCTGKVHSESHNHHSPQPIQSDEALAEAPWPRCSNSPTPGMTSC